MQAVVGEGVTETELFGWNSPLPESGSNQRQQDRIEATIPAWPYTWMAMSSSSLSSSTGACSISSAPMRSDSTSFSLVFS